MNNWIIMGLILLSLLIGWGYWQGQKNNAYFNNPVNVLSHMCGMSYSLADEQKIMARLKSQSIEQNSQYADQVAKANVMDLDFLAGQVPEDFSYQEITESDLNPTSIGNVAYIAVHSPEPYASRAQGLYQRLLFALQ